MAISVTTVKSQSYVWGSKRIVTVMVQGDNSYPTGGWPLLPSQVGLRAIGAVEGHNGVLRKSDNTAIVTLAYDGTNKKLLAYQGATQVANATDLSTYSGRITFVSI